MKDYREFRAERKTEAVEAEAVQIQAAISGICLLVYVYASSSPG
jgi:hypothetical protein